KRHRRCNDLVSPVDHPFSNLEHTAAERLQTFKHIDEDVSVEKYLAHLSSRRRFSTYSSACSSAHMCFPEPIRRMRGSSSQLIGASGTCVSLLHSSYQSSNCRYCSEISSRL